MTQRIVPLAACCLAVSLAPSALAARNSDVKVESRNSKALVAGEPRVPYYVVEKGHKLVATVKGPGELSVLLHGAVKGALSTSAVALFLDKKKVHFVDLRGAASIKVSEGGYSAGPLKTEKIAIPDGSHEIGVEAFVGAAAVSFRLSRAGGAAAKEAAPEAAAPKRQRTGKRESRREKAKERKQKSAAAVAVAAVPVAVPPTEAPPAPVAPAPVAPKAAPPPAPVASAASTTPAAPATAPADAEDSSMMMGEPPPKPAAAQPPAAAVAVAKTEAAKTEAAATAGKGEAKKEAAEAKADLAAVAPPAAEAAASTSGEAAPAPAAATSVEVEGPSKQSSAPYWLGGAAIVLGAGAGVAGYLSSSENQAYAKAPETNSARAGMLSTANTELLIAEGLATGAVVALAIGYLTAL